MSSNILQRGAPLAAMFGPAGVALVAGAEIYGGIEAERAGKETEALAKYNAAVMESQAKQIETVTGLKQQRQAEAATRLASEQEAGFGAAGAVTTVGSPLMIMAKQASESELEGLMIGYEGMTAAEQARAGARMELWKGKMARKAGKREMIGKFIGAGGTLLTGFARAGAKVPTTGLETSGTAIKGMPSGYMGMGW